MNTFTHTVQASTPQEFKEAVIKWLNGQATIHRVTARNAKTVRYEKEHVDKAESLEYAAKFIYDMVIEDAKPMTEDELFEGLDSNRRSDEV